MDWDGFGIVVDLDLEKFFDTLNQDFLMNILRERIKDKALIELIKRFLRSGVVLPDGLRQETRQGSPQGGPLSPLLSNIYLDRFDRLLESRGLRFCRYADDRLIFVRTPRAGERVRESVTRYLESDLKLKVNQEKTVVGGADTVKFPGFKLFRNKAVHVNIHPSSLESFRKAVREKTKRNRNGNLVSILDELKTYVRGWFG
ncbi:MAG: reverse transcriptase domain-containing protein [Methanomethylophilus alvi]|nr:reverse transcriptase domain-containing protein [Methanomethylophilus alvi]